MELTVHVPGNILPVDRGARFADPLDAALRAAGVGELGDEGTQMDLVDGRYVVVGCDIHLTVSDTARALAIIQRVLADAGAPAGTTITERGGMEKVHRFQVS